MAEQLSDVDRDALDRCMTIAMRDKLSAEQLNSKLDDGEPWADVAASASYGVQGSALRLKPWQEPPCIMDADDPSPDDDQAQQLLCRMLAAGLSRYEPDPLKALSKKRPKRVQPRRRPAT
jgi:hypothetical protein